MEQKLKDRIADLKGKADRAAQIKDALKDLQAPDGKAPKEGPGKDLKDALAKGDFQKAADEVEKIRKKLDKGEMKPEEREQLEKEMRDLERQLQRLGQMQELRDRLKQALDKGELDREQFDQEMQNLDELAGDLQDLQDLANQLGECLQCLNKGDKQGAGKKLKALAGKLAKLDADGKELKGLQDNQDALKGHVLMSGDTPLLDDEGQPKTERTIYHIRTLLAAVREGRHNQALIAKLAGALPEGDDPAEATRELLKDPAMRRLLAQMEARAGELEQQTGKDTVS